MINGVFDLDGTLANWIGWVSKTLGRAPEAYKSRSLEEAYGINKQEAVKLLNNPNGYGGNVQPISGAAFALRSVYNTGRFRFYYLSAAPMQFQNQRLLWMLKHRFPVDPNNAIGATLLHTGSSPAKKMWLKERVSLITFIVDDDLDILDYAAEIGIPQTILVSTRFNLYATSKHEHRVGHSWQEIRGMLLYLAE